MGESELRVGHRVHSAGDPQRIGSVAYVGPIEGYSGEWVGVEWDSGDGKHDGSVNGVRYFRAKSERSGSFVRAHNLSLGVSLLQALHLRYRSESTKEEEDEMYVFSSSNKRVSVELLGKDKIQDKLSRFEELTGVSLSFLGVSSPGSSSEISALLPNLNALDLTGNLLADWKDIGTICKELPALSALNLSYNLMAEEIVDLPLLRNLRTLVLNNTGLKWTQVEMLKHSFPSIEELHLMGNDISTLDTSSAVQGFHSLRLLNLDENCIAEWTEVLKLSQLKSLQQLQLNKNNLNRIFYPDADTENQLLGDRESQEKSSKPFENLRCLLLGANNVEDAVSVDALNSFPKLMDIRLSDNPISDHGSGGMPRFVLIARLARVEIMNGSEVRPRERRESEIRYVRSVMSKLHGNHEDIHRINPRFGELKDLHGIDDEKLTSGPAGPQKMSSGLLSITLKCVGASMGEKAPLTKKLPGTTTVGKLKILCESFFKLKSIKLKLLLQEEGSPFPALLDDEMASLVEVGVCNESTILVDEEET